ncbi:MULTISPECIES: LpqN/LpqT family lipoprotein [unclassified Mycobacterium]|uniref:LpqN/LpqT family lipoprotein n=1 Tax=unclassified Mycobacterium TaxID=2642494 RepID=UPI0029C802DF|nr:MULTISPECIES: LpqN/LpqT family lipoprotein [unclassified Mycobacterium]
MAVMHCPGVAAFAAICLSITIGGCSNGSYNIAPDRSTPTSSTSWTISTKPPAETTAANDNRQEPRSLRSEPGAANYTIADYIRDQHITATPIRRGDPGAPQIEVAFPSGWIEAGQQAPEYAYGAVVYTGPETQSVDYPPNIVATLSKLDGKVDPTKLLEFAGGELKNLPGFDLVGDESAMVSGYHAYRIAGGYDFQVVKAAAAQETIVIPGPGGLYVLQLDATSNERDAQMLVNGLGEIVASLNIKP